MFLQIDGLEVNVLQLWTCHWYWEVWTADTLCPILLVFASDSFNGVSWSLSMYIVHSAPVHLCRVSAVDIILRLSHGLVNNSSLGIHGHRTFVSHPGLINFISHMSFPFRDMSSSDNMKRKVNDHIFHWHFYRFWGNILRMSKLQLSGCSHFWTGTCRIWMQCIWASIRGRALAINITELETEQTFQGCEGWMIPKNTWVILLKALITFIFIFSDCWWINLGIEKWW